MKNKWKLFTILLICLGFMTTGRGQAWTAQNSQTSEDLHCITFVGSTTGWAMGKGHADGTVRMTPNGGKTWNAQTFAQADAEIRGSHFFDAMFGVGVGKQGGAGNKGLLIRTSNGGQTWTVDNTSFTDELFAVHFTPNLMGWAVGAEGTVSKSMDGGFFWMSQSTGMDDDLYDVFALNDSVVMAVGEKGAILRSQDGGVNWTAITSPTSRDLHAIYFPSPQQGWAVGESGTAIHTVDGGETWTAQVMPSGREMLDVHFVSDLSGWVVGQNGTILHTTDGGLTWMAEQANTSRDILSIYMQSDTVGWFCGENGVIHSYGMSSTAIGLQHEVSMYADISPNPSSDGYGVFTLKNLRVKSYDLTLYDMRGNKVFQQLNNTSPRQVLNLPHLTPGIYGLEVRIPNYRPFFLKWMIK